MQSRRSLVTKLIGLLMAVGTIDPCRAVAVETPEPASLLRPRDVNPHPYRNAYEGVAIFDRNLITNSEKFAQNLLNQGPIQFPRAGAPSVNGLPYPYEALALKERHQKMGRFAGADSPIVKPVYQALAKHGARVLGRSYTVDDNEIFNQEASTNVKKNYVFSYAVKDSASGDDFSHTQQQQTDGAVKGSYKVQLPDGRMQIVKYVADSNGYRADVTYENEPATAAVPGTPGAYNYYRRPTVSQRQEQEHQQPQYRSQPQVYYAATPAQIPAPFYPTQLRDVKIHSYNTAPHAGAVIASTTTQATPATGTYLATFTAPANLAYIAATSPIAGTEQSHGAALTAVPVAMITTASGASLPAYRDIHVAPPAPVQPLGVAFASAGRRTTVYAERVPQSFAGAGLQQTIYRNVQPTLVNDNTKHSVVANLANYIQGFVQIPADNRVYRRNTDRSTEVLTTNQSPSDHDQSKTKAGNQTKRSKPAQKATV
ncbi:uncharacterized protein LOC128276675 isoform X1 [Anopheles cruzii]|uniref:uncharacterized protein LOC128276675 isoform X1 n=1 Tax=Anopheles cruzii TaxID=68878 RepID=UPI0022EC6E41|nr:uncharacterized protein LOC128276675 isoform X1 [Anopheles cruzii]